MIPVLNGAQENLEVLASNKFSSAKRTLLFHRCERGGAECASEK